MRRILLTVALFSSASLNLMSQTNEERRAKIQEHERQKPSQEASERKARSEARLKKEGVPYVAHLPVIKDAKTAKTRAAEEIAKRAIAVCLAAVKGEGLDQATIDSLVKKFGADKFFTPEEAHSSRIPIPPSRTASNSPGVMSATGCCFGRWDTSRLSIDQKASAMSQRP